MYRLVIRPRICAPLLMMASLTSDQVAWPDALAGVSQTNNATAAAGRTETQSLSGIAHPREVVAVLGDARGRHWGEINTIAISPQASTIASAGGDRVIRLWDSATMRLIAELRGHTRAVRSISFRHDGRTLVSAGDDHALYVWDVEHSSLGCTATLGRPESPITSVLFAPHGDQIVCGTDDGIVRILSCRSSGLEERHRFQAHLGQVRCLAFTPDGSTLITAGDDKLVCKWEISREHALKGKFDVDSQVLFLNASPDGKLVAVTSTRSIYLFGSDGSTLVTRTGLDANATPIQSALLNRAAQTLFASSVDGNLEVWNIQRTARPIHVISRVGSLNCLALSMSGETLATGSSSGQVRLWRVKNQVPGLYFAPHGHVGPVRAVAFSKAGNLASLGQDKEVRLWAPNGHLQQLLSVAPRTKPSAAALEGGGLAFSLDDRWLAVGAPDGSIRLLNIHEGKAKETAVRIGHVSPLLSGTQAVDFAGHGPVVVSCGVDRAVRFWSVPGLQPLSRPPLYGSAPLTCVAVASDGQILAGGLDGSAWFWSADGTTDRPQAKVAFGSKVLAVAISPDTGLAAIGGGEVSTNRPPAAGRLTLLDLHEFPRIEPFYLETAPSAAVTALAFASDGYFMISGTQSGQLTLWEMATGKKLRDWQFPGSINSLAFAPDGKRFASANNNGVIYVFTLCDQRADMKPKANLNPLWEQLGAENAEDAYRAMCALASEKNSAVALLETRLKPVRQPNTMLVRRLVSQLDSEEFHTRESAFQALVRFGPDIRPTLTEVLQGNLSSEVRRRCHTIISQLHWIRSPETLRGLRAIRILEQIGSPNACKVLDTIGGGWQGAIVSRQASAALRRLNKRRPWI